MLTNIKLHLNQLSIPEEPLAARYWAAARRLRNTDLMYYAKRIFEIERRNTRSLSVENMCCRRGYGSVLRQDYTMT